MDELKRVLYSSRTPPRLPSKPKLRVLVKATEFGTVKNGLTITGTSLIEVFHGHWVRK